MDILCVDFSQESLYFVMIEINHFYLRMEDIEILEKNETPEGRHKLESYKNHLTDCIAFLLGWFIMDGYYKQQICNNILLRILKVIFVSILFSELLRELYPRCKGWCI